jgi:hypothetical protein
LASAEPFGAGASGGLGKVGPLGFFTLASRPIGIVPAVIA